MLVAHVTYEEVVCMKLCTLGLEPWGISSKIYFEFCRWLLIFHSHLVLWFLYHITDIDPACAVH